MSEQGEYPVPFFEKSHKIQEETWGGAENKLSSIAFNIPEGTKPEDIKFDQVIKEPREENYIDSIAKKFPAETEGEKQAIKNLSDYFSSKEHFLNTQKDFQVMEEIFGELLPKTQFITDKPRKGNQQGLYILQDKIIGQNWTEFSKNRTHADNQEFMMSHKEQLMKLIGGARKTLIELGATVDIWGDNLMVDNNNNFVFVDPGSPSELNRHFDTLKKLPKGMRSYFANNLLVRINDLDKYPSAIKMSDEEIRLMNKNMGITNRQYMKANNELRRKCSILLQ